MLSFSWGKMKTEAQETAFQIALRSCSEKAREVLRYIGLLQQRAGSLNVKSLLLIKETRYLKELSAFLCMGRYKSLGSLKSCLWYIAQLCGASLLCFSYPGSLRAHLLTVCDGCNYWWLGSLLTNMAGNTMFISLKCIWYLIELLKMSEFIGWTISYKVAGQLWRVGSGGEEFLVWVREESRLHSIVIETCAGFHKRARDLRDMVFKEHESFICFQSKSEGNEMQILEANKHLVNTHTLVSVLEND